MHSIDDPSAFGKGNLGAKGIDKFLSTHHCNAICRYLKLPAINARYSDLGTLPGTQYMRYEHVEVVNIHPGLPARIDTNAPSAAPSSAAAAAAAAASSTGGAAVTGAAPAGSGASSAASTNSSALGAVPVGGQSGAGPSSAQTPLLPKPQQKKVGSAHTTAVPLCLGHALTSLFAFPLFAVVEGACK